VHRQSTLKQRMILCLAAFFVALAAQIVLSFYQSGTVLRELDDQMGNFNAISRFQNGVERSLTALDEYRWKYGDTDAFLTELDSAFSTMNAWLWRIDGSLDTVSEEQYLLYSAVCTTYKSYAALIDEVKADVAAAALALTACGGSSNSTTSTAASSAAASTTAGDAAAAASDPKVTLVYAEVNPLDTIVGQTATHFKEKVEELTGGSVVIDVQASGVLGSENDVLDAILGGSTSIDMSRISAFALTSYGCNKSKLLSIPFTFENRAHFWNFANSDLAPEFLNEPQELGLPVRGIFYGEEGFRHFFTVNPVSGIEDFKGLKLRVSNDPVMNGMVEGLGANPTVVSFGELYSALQTGVVDGAEQPIANYKSNAFPEVANNLILDGHTLGAIQAVITDNAWGKLTENQQAAIMEAGADTQAFNADLSESAENKVLDELKSSGCNVVDVPDKTPWQEACQKVISENTSDQAELYQQLLDMKG
jgi:tripartite ATP-independent transporter DctP family solute receptor